MAKSMRSKREKRLRAIRREIVEPFYEKKDEAKFAAQEAALAAPKLPVRSPKTNSMEIATPTATSTADNNMDVEMADGTQTKGSLKPVGGIGKKSLKKLKVGKNKRRGKGRKKPNF
ncbi:hypothetical protein WN944_011756 [Citrus x changshan-huyou]|uniref:Uncharacterized protein n=3 Tax=Citrus TaxID=2706 RepID=A0ACB8NCT7_CITSI|nr:uncharacterized protein LOC102611829 [Citrus sinensis]KAH9747086.1 hypothetical protein KPL70_004608 [Citrus sinensis]KAH9795409.1 hypothetical protein KPL71_005207 [Citrus sinensis]KDO77196.1 hypothetical protein CISIN_1g033622mg [Citrus sinensis]